MKAECIGLVFGKFDPFHKGHEFLVRRALDHCDKIIMLVYDHPGLDSIPTKERVQLIRSIIDDKKLKIIEAYGSPIAGYSKKIRKAHNDYLHKQLQRGIKINKVFCNEWYGKDIAKSLKAKLIRIDPKRKKYGVSGRDISKNPEKYLKYLHPLIAKRLLKNDFIDMDSLNKISKKNAEKFKRKIRRLNLNQDEEKLFGIKYWNIKDFNRKNLPINVGRLRSKKIFSKPKGIRFLDMPIRMPRQGWAIPLGLSQFKEVIFKAAEYERITNPNFYNLYVYITVDQKNVKPNKSQRRPGCHSDAYITDELGTQMDVVAENRKYIEKQKGELVENTYICYDKLPTEFFPGPFSLKDTKNCDKVLKNFDQTSKKQKPIKYPSHTLLRLNPYDIHRASINETGKTLKRTFVKISFSKKKYNRKGNTINTLFNYKWKMIPRNPKKRGHRYASPTLKI